MASGSSSGLPNSGSKGFDFASDDILCSYEDYVNQDNNSNNNNSNNNNNGTQSDHSLPVNPTQDFQKSRISRSSMFPTTNVYNQPEESMNQELISTVERTMKKYADNLMRFLEGISSRLSQLELYCYNLDKSIGEMRSDLVRDHGDADSKLKFLEKHLQEVHRSVQILRDKQELAETQKELAKLQFSQKEPTSSTQEEKAVLSPPEPKKSDDADTPNTQLALALPSQISTQLSAAPPQPPSQAVSQVPPYYLPHPQNHSQPSYLSADPQYRGLQPSQLQMNQAQQPQQYPQYQQQWSQQGGQSVPPPQPQPMPPSQQQPIMPPQQQPMMPPQQPQMPPPQQPPMQPGQLPNQMRAQAPQSQVYPPYMTHQPSNPLEPMQVPFPGSQQSVASRPEAMTYGYGGPGRPTQPQLPPQHFKGGFPAHQGDGYAAGGSHPAMSSGGPYMLYDSDGGRPLHASQQTHFSQSGYPPANTPPPNMPPPNNNSLMIRSPSPQQHIRSHPYNELIEKLVSMGYRGDHVVREIQRVEESGQPVDFNSVLDRINGHSPGSSQRSW